MRKLQTFPHHEELTLTNFTTFADAKFTFSPTINVLVGENGTGKTHLMKALYAIQLAHMYNSRRTLEGGLKGLFQTSDLVALVRNGLPSTPISKAECVLGGIRLGFTLEPDPHTKGQYEAWNINTHNQLEGRPIFIPAIDMMGHTRRFLSTYDEYQIDFDQTHRDIVGLLLAPERRNPTQNPETAELLAGLLGGKVEEENERFYLRTPEGRQPMPLVAEGLRKIATLYQLIRNGFLEPGSVLFWDEPEVNVNPKLMDEIVDVLLRLARSGVQIFLSTHSYVILKELDLQSKALDGVRYFGLERTDNGTVAHATDDYSQLYPNAISEQFDRLYDMELTRVTGRKRKPR